jgi:hypothetical protein
MSSNTKARSNELNTLAAEIAARENINPHDYDRDNRPYITEIMERGECHKETARSVWSKWLRRNRHPNMAAQWGGTREGAGRKNKLPE